MAETTLEKMAKGGVYDQLAGGFHRYSVDERWLVPHFEKMSYDNSELLKNYLHGWQVTQNPLLRETAEGIIGWVNEVLSDQANGGFYASQDADFSLDDDGDYFTWTLKNCEPFSRRTKRASWSFHYDVEPRRRDAPQSREKCALDRARSGGDCENAGPGRGQVRLSIASQKGKCLRPRAAAHALRRSNDVRQLERDVRLGLSEAARVL